MPPPISLPTPAQIAARKLSNKSPRPAGGKKRPSSSERRRDRRLRALRLPLTIPLLLAAFIALGLNPIVAGLARVHVPRMLGSILLMLVVGVGVGAAVNALSTPAAQWIRQAPTVMRDVGFRLNRMARPLTEVSHAASRSLAGMGVVASAPTVQAAPAP